MQNFYYSAPNAQEQRSFFILFCGALLSCLVVALLIWKSENLGLRAALLGLALGVLYLLAREAWRLETKARRAQNAEIGVDETGLQIVDEHGKMQSVTWQEIEKTEVVNGKLQIKWRGGETKFSSREIENGMELIQLIAARAGSTPSAKSPSNFIPLSPK